MKTVLKNEVVSENMVRQIINRYLVHVPVRIPRIFTENPPDLLRSPYE